MRLLLKRIRLCFLLVLLAAVLNGCLFGSLSVFVSGQSVFISTGNVNIGVCAEDMPATYICIIEGLLSKFQTLSFPELLFTLVLLDPVVVQLPAGVTNFSGAFLHNDSSTGGALDITAGLTSLAIDADRTLTAEPGTQFVVIGLPSGAPTTGNFSFNFNFDVPPGTTTIQVKPIITGRVQLQVGAGGNVFYPPVFPCVTDMASAPSMTVPLPVPDETLTFPPMSSDLGCKGITYNFVPGGAVPQALVVDAGGNGVLEPSETATVAPAWRHSGSGPLALSGTASGFDGPAGLTYTIPDIGAGYGNLPPATTVSCDATANCYAMALSPPMISTPSARGHVDATFQELLSTGVTKTWTLHVGDSFTDVPRASPFYRFIETLLHRGVTSGCSATGYCPGNPTTREQMAVFIVRARGEFDPPQPATQRFADVPPASPFYRFVERMAVLGITSGCGGSNYCPTSPVTREQMAAFMIRALGEFDPPLPPTQRFADVPPTNPFYRFIDRMAVLGITSGCGGGNYCPTDPVTREQMSVFLTTAFGLTLYGP